MLNKRCLIIPAIKKNAVIPDQLVKKLAGKTLIQHAIDTALDVASANDIYVVTDSDEIRLICERNGIQTTYDPAYRIASSNIVTALKPVLKKLAKTYENIVIYRASAPLIQGEDIEHAYEHFVKEGSDCLVTVKSVKQRLWYERGHEHGQDIDSLLFNDNDEEAYIETKALFILKAASLQTPPASLKITPYFLNDRGIEINGYQDWWICEKILQTRHLVFVVAGYPAIGMGHVYRGLMLAHEISDHRITFLCTQESELAASTIIARDYHVKIQQSNDLAAEVLQLKPDLVINDFLDTEATYINCLKEHGAKVVNFEDEGSGAAHADLVINALYESHMCPDPHYLYGYHYFCLRDEFLAAHRNTFKKTPKEVLISFGGTDSDNFTGNTLETLFPLCLASGIRIAVIVGPGYEHKNALKKRIDELNTLAFEQLPDAIAFSHATNVISRYMEKADFAICSAGRTVYELTYMRIPAIVMAHHAREDMHAFARPRNGFLYLGIMHPFNKNALIQGFEQMLDATYRKELYTRQNRFDFTGNKSQVVKRMLNLLKEHHI